MSKPCLEKSRSWWDGAVITWCGKRVPPRFNRETWLTYNAITKSDTCETCVRKHAAAR